MDEEVIKDLFDRATSLGYKKGIEDFKNLILSDNDVLQDNFNYVKEKGYSKGIEDFSSLLGIGQVKKKSIQRLLLKRKVRLHLQNKWWKNLPLWNLLLR